MDQDAFKPARLPANEQGRLAAVKRTGLMDSANIARFDHHARLFRHIAQVPLSYTGLLDETRQYFLAENFTGCLTGARDVARQDTVCQHALLDTKPYIVPDMRIDPVFARHPLVTGDPHWVFWAGFPLVTDEGYVLGTICAVDYAPRQLTGDQIDLLRGVAADLTRSIQMQADQQELIARKSGAVLAALQQAGVTSIDGARAFLDLCLGKTLGGAQAAAVIANGLAVDRDGAIVLTALGASLKTGQGLGPADYKAVLSPIRNAELLGEMFDMMDEAGA
jgi:uncharacterized protein YrrD